MRGICFASFALLFLSCKIPAKKTTSTAASLPTSPSLSAGEIPAWESLSKNSSQRALEYRVIAEKILAKSQRPMTAAENCTAFTVLWIQALNKEANFKVQYAETNGSAPLQLRAGQSVMRDKQHIFVVDRKLCQSPEAGPCDSEIIIDPTFIQFFEPGECLYGATDIDCAAAKQLSDFPKILIGTSAEIIAFYKKNEKLLRLDGRSGIDLKAGQWNGESAAKLIYSLEFNSHIRTNLPLM